MRHMVTDASTSPLSFNCCGNSLWFSAECDKYSC